MTIKLLSTAIAIHLILLLRSVVSSDEQDSCSNEESCIQATAAACGLYLAPSTIPGAGLGLFAGTELNPGDVVGPGDVAIPIVDIKYHTGRKGTVGQNTKVRHMFNMFADYQWAGKVMGMQQESDDDTGDMGVTAHAPGMDSVINCHLGLLNVGKAVPIYKNEGITRYTSPGAGAMTPYYNGTTHVEQYIPAGGELFKYYGDNYFTSRTKYMGLIPLRQDYTGAEEICQAWMNLNVSGAIKDDLWSSVIKDVPWESRATNAFPDTAKLARQVVSEGSIRTIHQPQATRSLEELERIGRCQDNIRHGTSKLPHAGRGAFATRPLRKDAIIAGSPLLHIPDRNFTYMYEYSWIDPPGSWQRNLKDRKGSQIVVNYCWGHVDSTLLLCPYGTGVNFLNHNQTLTNVRLQWPVSSGVMAHNTTWLELLPSEMFEYKINLAIDFVALRDIKEGEELFVDYGNIWEVAWKKHVQRWKPSKKWEHYAPAQVWNEQMGAVPLRTRKEQRYEPYPKHIIVNCHHSLKKNNWAEYIQARGEELWRLRDKGMQCDIVRRYQDTEELVYDVRFSFNNGSALVIRKVVPREAFHFIDVPYSTDIHQLTAFRHAAQLPDYMVAEIWRNDVQQAE